jgi:hypothetical protein
VQLSNTQLHRSNYILWLIACTIIIIGKLHHEMWLDEWQAFQIAKEANNPIHLYTLRNLEGHPYLYFFIIYITTLFSKSVLLYQAMQFAFAAATMYLLIVKLPLHFFQKILLALSYYFMWEFTVLNRSYIISIFFILLFAYKLLQDKFSSTLLWILLIGLVHTSAYSAPFAPALLLLWIIKFKPSRVQIITYCIFLAILLMLFVVSVIPQASNTMQLHVGNLIGYSRLVKECSRFIAGNLTLHELHIYNSVVNLQHGVVPLAMLIYAACIYSINGVINKTLFSITCVGIALLVITTDTVNYRHFGFYFIAYLCFYAIGNAKQPITLSLKTIPLILILFFQAYAGINMYKQDYHNPFSAGPATAKYIQQNGFGQYPIVGYYAHAINSISGNLNKPVISLFCWEPHTYCKWEKNEFGNTTDSSINLMYSKLNSTHQQLGNYVLVINYSAHTKPFIKKLDSICNLNVGLNKMPEFTGALYGSENYFLYHVKSNRLP